MKQMHWAITIIRNMKKIEKEKPKQWLTRQQHRVKKEIKVDSANRVCISKCTRPAAIFLFFYRMLILKRNLLNQLPALFSKISRKVKFDCCCRDCKISFPHQIFFTCFKECQQCRSMVFPFLKGPSKVKVDLGLLNDPASI